MSSIHQTNLPKQCTHVSGQILLFCVRSSSYVIWPPTCLWIVKLQLFLQKKKLQVVHFLMNPIHMEKRTCDSGKLGMHDHTCDWMWIQKVQTCFSFDDESSCLLWPQKWNEAKDLSSSMIKKKRFSWLTKKTRKKP